MTTFKTIYYSSYYSNFNRKTTVKIMKKDYALAPAEITLGQDPLFIRMIEDENIYEQIKGCEATLNIYSPSFMYYSNLYIHKAKTYQLFVYHGDDTAEILDNRFFHGSLSDWAVTTNFTPNYNAAFVNNTASDALLIQNANFPADGTYTIRVNYHNALPNETIEIKYNSVSLGTTTLTESAGTFTYPVVITSGILDKEFRLVKSWSGTPAASNLAIAEISILLNTATEHDYNLFFNGYIDNTTITEPYVNDTYVLQLRAYCGLGELSEIEFLSSEVNGEKYYYGEAASLLTIIKNCISKTQVYLPIKTKINLWESSTMDDGDDPLELYTNTERFRDKDKDNDSQAMMCQDVLKEILKPFGARIYQANGSWHIERIADKYLALNQYVYDQFGNYITKNLAVDDTFSLTVGTAADDDLAVPTNSTQYLKVVQPWKKFELKQDLGYRNSLIYGDFDPNFWTSATTLTHWTGQYGAMGNYERNKNCFRWKQLGDYEPVIPNMLDDCMIYNWGYWPDSILSFHDAQTPPPLGGFIRQSRLTISIKCKSIRTDTIYPTYINIRVPFQVIITASGGVATYYLMNSGTNVGTWTTTVAYCWMNTEDESLEITTDLIPGAANYHLDVRLIWPRKLSTTSPSVQAYTEISNFRIVKNIYTEYNDTEAFDFKRNQSIQINSNNEETEEVNCILGDLSRIYWSNDTELNAKNGLLWANRNKQITRRQWGVWGATVTHYDLVYHFLKTFYDNQFYRPRFVLSADITGNLDFTKVAVEAILTKSRNFLFIGGEYNDYYHQLSGEWCEIGKREVNDWAGEGDFEPADFEPADFITTASTEE